MAIQKVILIGANGNLGPAVLSALINSGDFTVSVATRVSSKSTYPSSINVISIPDDLSAASEEPLQRAFAGQDAVICAFDNAPVDSQIALANAAAAAGVQRFIPADFGSVCSSDPEALRYVPLYGQKGAVRKHLQGLVEKHGHFAWTSLVPAHFFDFGLKSGLLGINVRERTARVFDGGDWRWSASTLGFIGEAVVKILKNEAVKNKLIYVQSFCTTQGEVLKILEKITGDTFERRQVSSKEHIEAEKKKMDQGDSEATEEVVGVLGMTRSNFETGNRLANEMLGLKEEDLETVIRKVYSELV